MSEQEIEDLMKQEPIVEEGKESAGTLIINDGMSEADRSFFDLMLALSKQQRALHLRPVQMPLPDPSNPEYD